MGITRWRLAGMCVLFLCLCRVYGEEKTAPHEPVDQELERLKEIGVPAVHAVIVKMLAQSPLAADKAQELATRWCVSAEVQADSIPHWPRGRMYGLQTPYVAARVGMERRVRKVSLRDKAESDLMQVLGVARRTPGHADEPKLTKPEVLKIAKQAVADVMPEIGVFVFDEATYNPRDASWQVSAPELTAKGGYPLWMRWRSVWIDDTTGCVLSFVDVAANEPPPKDIEPPKITKEEACELAEKIRLEWRPIKKPEQIKEKSVETKLYLTEHYPRSSDEGKTPWRLVWFVQLRWKLVVPTEEGPSILAIGNDVMLDAHTGEKIKLW